MNIKEKISSRKLWITLVLIILSTIMKYLDKLDDLYYAIIVLSSAIIYIFVEGTIDVNKLKIKTEIIELGKEDASKEKI
ncbi:MAG: hypothetical protein KatS3mg068_1542 [Candidatus Sericytochromatia bacterium]|nr:MAG: hypothetical protein KatS3mg068_1542 [Candidatus Sericytochromatia bacterium]